MMLKALMIIRKRDGRFHASFPDLPGCTAESDTRNDLYDKAADALTRHVAHLFEEGHPIPHIRTERELLAVGALQPPYHAYMLGVEIDLPVCVTL
jgi:predicted RNase H-like HicB family nuclease